MAVLCRLTVLCALLFSATTPTKGEPVQSNEISNELQNLLFDAISGALQVPELSSLGDLKGCAPEYTVKNVRILIGAGSMLRQCSNLSEGELQSYLQGESSADAKAAFQQQLLGCSTHNCVADAVMNLFAAVHLVHKHFWQTQRCVIHAIRRTQRELELAHVGFDKCISESFPHFWNNTTPSWNLTTDGVQSNWTTSSTASWNYTATTSSDHNQNWTTTEPPSWNWTTASWNASTPNWSGSTPNWNWTAPSWNETTSNWNWTTPNWNQSTTSWNWTISSTSSWNLTTPHWNQSTPGGSWTTPSWNATLLPGWNETTLSWNATTPGWSNSTNSWNVTTEAPATPTTPRSWLDQLLYGIGL